MTRILEVLFLIFLLETVVHGSTMRRNYKRWTDRFYSKSAQQFLRSLPEFPLKKTLDAENRKKDEITPSYDSIAKTDVQNFPSTNQTKKMMFALFGEEGLFMKENFERSGEIHIEGPALISIWKIFSNKTVLLRELRSSKNASIGSSVLSVLTQMLFLPEEIAKLETWLEEGIEAGDEENNMSCRPKVVINYKCCAITGEPILAPEFGTIEMGVD